MKGVEPSRPTTTGLKPATLPFGHTGVVAVAGIEPACPMTVGFEPTPSPFGNTAVVLVAPVPVSPDFIPFWILFLIQGGS